jgi:hypothetical protein
MSNLGMRILRGASLIFALLGALLYIFFLYDTHIQWRQDLSIHESWLTEVWFVISIGIFASGLPPMLLVVYFWVLGEKPRDWRAGFVFVPIFIFSHYVVAVFMAHSSPMVYVPMMAVELLSAIAVIWYWYRKNMIDKEPGSNCI